MLLKFKNLVGLFLTSKPAELLLDCLRIRNVMVEGLRFDVTNPRVKTSSRGALFFGFYESAERRSLAMIEFEGDVVELGSSIGVVSCLIRRRMKKAARLLCVEADIELATIAGGNLVLNGLADNSTICNAAVVGVPMASVQFVRGSISTTGGIVRGQLGPASITIPAYTIDQIREKLSIERYSLVCDIEGEEWNLVSENSPVLVGCVLLLIEVHMKPGVDSTPEEAFLRFTNILRPTFTLLRRDGFVGTYRRKL